jgi:hypothetical protein
MDNTELPELMGGHSAKRGKDDGSAGLMPRKQKNVKKKIGVDRYSCGGIPNPTCR